MRLPRPERSHPWRRRVPALPPGLQDVVPRARNVTYFVPSDAALAAFFQRFSPQTAQVGRRALCGNGRECVGPGPDD